MTDLPHVFEADALKAAGAVGSFLLCTRDDAGRIVYATPVLERLFGYDSGGLVGVAVEDLIPERFRAEHRRQRLAYNADPSGRPEATGVPVVGLTKAGAEVPLTVGLACRRTEPPGVHDLVFASVVRRVELGRHARLRPEVAAGAPPESRGMGAGLVGLALAALLFFGLPTQALHRQAEGETMAAKSSFAEGVAAMRRGHNDEALICFGAAKSPKATAALAECYYYLGRDDDALAACDRLKGSDQQAARAHYVRGLVWLRQGKAAEARRELVRAVALGDTAAVTLL